MYVSNHVGSVSSTAAARGFSTFAWSLTDLRSFCATPRPLLTALRTGRAAPGPGRRPPRRRRAPRGACSLSRDEL